MNTRKWIQGNEYKEMNTTKCNKEMYIWKRIQGNGYLEMNTRKCISGNEYKVMDIWK